MRTPQRHLTALTVAAAAAVLAVGCTSDDDAELAAAVDPDSAEEVEEADDDEPDPAVVAAAEVESAYVEFVAVADRFDYGEAELDDALATLTAERAAEYADTWSPALPDGGNRHPNVVDVDVDLDAGAATVVDCLRDDRVTTEELPAGMWREVTAELAVEDGEWKVDEFTDFHGADTDATCLPDEVADQITDLSVQFSEVRWDTVSEASAPDHAVDPMLPFVTHPNILEDDGEFNGWYEGNGAHLVVEEEIGVTFSDLTLPDVIHAITCGEAVQFDAVDTATGDLIEDVSAGETVTTDLYWVRDGDSWQVDRLLSPAEDPSACDGVQRPHTVRNF